MSTSNGEATTHVTGYTGRGLGYATFHSGSGISMSQLEDLLNAGYPIVVLQWGMEKGTPDNYGHFRVVIGYNDVTQMVKVHDPASWLLGANAWLSYSDFADYWDYALTANKAILTCPWDVSVTSPATVSTGDTFTVTVDASYPRPSPFTGFPTASSCEATITLPAGLSLDSGETNPKTLGTGSMTAGGSSESVSWDVVASTGGAYSISIEAEGQVSSSISGHPSTQFTSGFSYTDRIGGVDSASVTCAGAPVADANGPYTGYEGSPIVLDASGSSSPVTIVLYEWDWENDGTYDYSTVSPTTTHTWGTAWTGTSALRVTDGNGGTDTDTCSVTVNPEEINDVEAVSQTATVTSVEPGIVVDIEVIVRNNGDFDETFDITCYYDGVPIGTQTITLGPSDSTTLTFTWDTTDVPLNEYLITAWADSGETIVEVDELNNWCDMELPIFVVPELPLGTVMALASMLAAIALFRKRPSIKI